MTNYNKRLDEILETLNNKAREERASCTERNNWEGYNSAYERLENETKQAITSLIKELVAEAKPPYRDNTNSVVPLPEYDDTVSMVANQAIDNYEANLLKALEDK